MTLIAVWILLAQGTTQTVAQPNPYANPARVQAARTSPARTNVGRVIHGPAHGRTRWIRPYTGGTYLGGQNQEVVVESPAPTESKPLQELIVSPVYQREKINPKMIEIP